jgi:hypothetical protein
MSRIDCSGIAGTDEMKPWYIPVYLSKMVLLALLSSLGLWFSYDYISFGILTLLSTYLLIILFFRPYQSIFSNLTIIFCESASILSLTVVFVNKYSTLTISGEILLLIVMEGFVIVSVALCIVRGMIFYRKLWKNRKSDD